MRLLGQEPRHSRTLDENMRRRQVCSLQVSALEAMTDADRELIQETELEWSRAGRWRCVFPAEGVERYLPLFESRRYNNILLAEWLIASKKPKSRPSSSKRSALAVSVRSSTAPK